VFLVRAHVIAYDNVFSGLFSNGAESWRDPKFYKNVVENKALNETVSSRRSDADAARRFSAGNQTRVL
jgi:hypothetical protein